MGSPLLCLGPEAGVSTDFCLLLRKLRVRAGPCKAPGPGVQAVPPRSPLSPLSLARCDAYQHSPRRAPGSVLFAVVVRLSLQSALGPIHQPEGSPVPVSR